MMEKKTKIYDRHINQLSKDKELLNDLHHRLTLDYSGDRRFEQHEEDRLIVGHILDMIEELESVDRACFKKACEDYNKVCEMFAGKSYKECKNILKKDKTTYNITNDLKEEYIDFNYGAGCFTLVFTNDDMVNLPAKVSTMIEVWNDTDCAYLGTYDIETCKQKAHR